jgi:hypothetical protein
LLCFNGIAKYLFSRDKSLINEFMHNISQLYCISNQTESLLVVAAIKTGRWNSYWILVNNILITIPTGSSNTEVLVFVMFLIDFDIPSFPYIDLLWIIMNLVYSLRKGTIYCYITLYGFFHASVLVVTK